MITPEKQAEIERRARQDAIAHKAGWPVSNPYPSVDEATLWKKAFDTAIRNNSQRGEEN